MASTSDLDLSKVESTDTEGLVSKVEGYYKQDSSQKISLAYNWEKNALMLSGNQWLVYQGNQQTGGSWVKLQPTPQNEYIPRPVTNYLFDAYQTLKSYMLKNKPRSTVRPNTQTQQDKTAAKIAELVLETNYERLRESYNYEYAASCLITYGTVFKKDYWDSSFLSLARIPRMEQQPVTDPATGQPTGDMQEVQAVDPATGQPIFDEIPLGDVNTCIVEPFRIALDPVAVNLHEARWIMEYSIRPLTWIVENYNKEDEGYTNLASEVKEEKSLSSSLRRFFNLKTSSGVRGSSSMGLTSSGGSDQMIDSAAVVKEYYERPTQKYPKGRLIVVANGVLLYSGESPYRGPDQGDWHPYSECRWEVIPDRFWGKSPFDDATEIQKQINSIDSVITLTRKTVAVPQKMRPKGSIQNGVWTGQPGQEIEYIPGPNGEKPETIQPSGVHDQVFKEREQKVLDLKNITGAVDILKGDRPPGVTAASALALLFEVGTGKLFPILDRWKYFIESSGKKQLRLVANKYREPRPQFINMLTSRNKELTKDQIERFIGEDLYDNCNVIIEAASSIPRLKAAEHALLLELASQGILNLDNPANRQEFLSRFGINGFDADYSKDVERARWENDVMDASATNPDSKPIVLDVDVDDVHIGVHSAREKEPSFLALPFAVQQLYIQHRMEHEQQKLQKMQTQMMQAAASGAQPSPPPANPMQAQQPVTPGDGVGDKTRKLLTGDMFGPTAGMGD
jgi:hypothetical protein